jgi:hypothetical protein
LVDSFGVLRLADNWILDFHLVISTGKMLLGIAELAKAIETVLSFLRYHSLR